MKREASLKRTSLVSFLDSIASLQDHAASDHVMQRLFLLCEARHDVSDEGGHHVRHNLAEVPSCCAPKGHTTAVHVGHHEAQSLLPNRRLPFRTLHQRVIESSEWQATVGKKALGLEVTDRSEEHT